MSGKTISLLTIGNSFSQPLTKFLDKIVKTHGVHQLRLVSAYIGGCSLEQHWQNIVDRETGENQPKFGPYSIRTRDTRETEPIMARWDHVLDILKHEKFDIISIQQASHKSFDYATYQPFADDLIARIRKFNPTAEIIVQQTWSYASDSPFLAASNLDQTEMYIRLKAAYAQLCAEYGFDYVPTGNAVQLWRQKHSAAADDIVGVNRPATEDTPFSRDHIHLNVRGEYMQNCLWFGFLFGEDPRAVTYCPEEIDADEAAELRNTAAEALEQLCRPDGADK